MIKALRKMLKPADSAQGPRLPDGERIYAIGDIHGRLDLFDALIEAIEADDAGAAKADTTVILLGDLVDRGPDSRGVIKRARRWQKTRKVRIIMGNHEEMFLASIDDEKALRHFIRVGGKETILSYGIGRKAYAAADMQELHAMLADAVPDKHRHFIHGFEDMIRAGDYVFVHAGLHPNRTLEEQKPKDLRWIREKFLDHRKSFGPMVVHGHTIFEEVDERKNRIGVDTGAYRTGRLTALVLEGHTRRYIQAVEGKGGRVAIEHRDSAQ